MKRSSQQIRSVNETEAEYIFENDGSYVALTKELIVRLKEGVAYPEIERLLSAHLGFEIQQDRFDSRQYFITLKETSEPEVLNIANRLFETGLFEYAVPNFVHLDALQGTSPNDMLYYMQWNLKNNANQGVDIHAEDAWDITEGSPEIKIGLIDVGVDYNHEDLYRNLLPGYDVTGENTNGNVAGSIHGTACAGVIVAQKVGTYTYADNTSHPQGKWNSKMGYGLVDAHAALLKICANIKIENTAITGNVKLKACDDVHIQNATMKNGASLSIETSGNLTIDKDFIMEQNTSINVCQ